MTKYKSPMGHAYKIADLQSKLRKQALKVIEYLRALEAAQTGADSGTDKDLVRGLDVL